MSDQESVQRLVSRIREYASGRQNDVSRGAETPRLAALIVQKYGTGMADAAAIIYDSARAADPIQKALDEETDLLDPDWRDHQRQRWEGKPADLAASTENSDKPPSAVSEQKTKFWRRMAITLGVFAVIGPPIVYQSMRLGSEQATTVRTQLEVIWPNLMALPDNDKYLLAMLGLQCGLGRELIEEGPDQVPLILSCLKEAAADPDFRLRGSMSNATHELDRLLRDRFLPGERQGKPTAEGTA